MGLGRRGRRPIHPTQGHTPGGEVDRRHRRRQRPRRRLVRRQWPHRTPAHRGGPQRSDPGYLYYDATRGNLRQRLDEECVGLALRDLDGDPGSIAGADGDIGQNPVVAAVGGHLQLLYYDATRGNLRHAWTDASGWHFENLDGDTGSIAGADGDIGRSPALTVVNGQIQAFYYDVTRGNLRHAWTDASGWHFENLDGDPGSIAGADGDIGRNPGGRRGRQRPSTPLLRRDAREPARTPGPVRPAGTSRTSTATPARSPKPTATSDDPQR